MIYSALWTTGHRMRVENRPQQVMTPDLVCTPFFFSYEKKNEILNNKKDKASVIQGIMFDKLAKTRAIKLWIYAKPVVNWQHKMVG